MPDISAIEQQEFTIPVNILGNIILVTYKPFGITMDMSIQQLAAQQQANMSGLYDAFCATVSAWDLYEDDHKGAVPITPQRLSTLPGTLVMLLLEACMDDKQERHEQVKTREKDVIHVGYDAQLTIIRALNEAVQEYDSGLAKQALQVLNLLQATEV